MNYEYDSKNAFIFACEKNYKDMVKMLIDNFKIDPDQRFSY